jgi:hypothetical protein
LRSADPSGSRSTKSHLYEIAPCGSPASDRLDCHA